MLRFSKDGIRESSGNRMICRGFAVTLLCLLTPSGYAQTLAATTPRDPGIRPGGGAGQPFASGLTTGDLAFFNNIGRPQFTQVEAVADGLGPRFNLDSCA